MIGIGSGAKKGDRDIPIYRHQFPFVLQVVAAAFFKIRVRVKLATVIFFNGKKLGLPLYNLIVYSIRFTRYV